MNWAKNGGLQRNCPVVIIASLTHCTVCARCFHLVTRQTLWPYLNWTLHGTWVSGLYPDTYDLHKLPRKRLRHFLGHLRRFLTRQVKGLHIQRNGFGSWGQNLASGRDFNLWFPSFCMKLSETRIDAQSEQVPREDFAYREGATAIQQIQLVDVSCMSLQSYQDRIQIQHTWKDQV